MKEQFSNELYPVIDFAGKEQIDCVGGSKNFPVYKLSDGTKYVLMRKSFVNQFSEVAFSKLAKQVGIRAADNDFAVRGNLSAGVASKLFLKKNEKISDFEVQNAHCKHFTRSCNNIFQNADISKLHSICNNNLVPLHPDFCKNLIETYLFSVLSSNYDHPTDYSLGTYFIMNLRLTSDGKKNNLAPYHDMERTFLQNLNAYAEETCQEIRHGYLSNIPNLRSKYREIHDRFLDNLNSVDVKRLSDFSRPHLTKRFANNNANFTETLSYKFEKKLTQQIRFMKNFSLFRQVL